MGFGIAWSWKKVAHGVLLGAPAAIACVIDPAIGIPLALGVLPAASLGLRGSRRERALVTLVGLVAAVSILMGSVVSTLPVVAVVLVFVLCVGVTLVTADPVRRLAPLALTLGLPLYGAGLSEGSWSAGLAAALLILTGSCYAWLVSLVWPAGASTPRPPRTVPERSAMLVYGVQIGLAGAAAAALGFALGVDHPGWACTTALLVSRPNREQLDRRGWQRLLSVTGGAVVASAVAAIAPPDVVIALVVLATIAVATGTAGSRWYVFPFFSTLIVLSMLLRTDSEPASHWFLERVGLTLAGVLLALLAAWLVPRAGRLLNRHQQRL